MTRFEFSRRRFLATSGAVVVTFAVAGAGAAMRPPAAREAAKTAEAGSKTVALDQVDGFVAIDGKGEVTIFSGKVDLGTGVRTAMTQIAAEELSVPLARVTVIQGDTALTPDQGVTWGSLSVQVGGMQIRQACATARELLIGRASEKLGVPRAELTVRDGIVGRGGGKGVSYAKLVGNRRFETKVDAAAPLKSPGDYTIVGRPVPRLDVPGKLTGEFTYMQDFKLRGMLHARVVRPPAMKAALRSVDDAAARRIPGWVATVRKGSFLAVVARDEWSAIKGAQAVAAEWSQWAGLPEQAKLWDHVRATKVVKDEVLQSKGDVASQAGDGARRLEATYDFAIHTHGSIGPSCAVADFRGGKLTVWTASQATHLLRQQLANMLSLAPDAIRCIYLEGAGCYGRNGHEDAAADAALLSVETGRPVRVQWSRADEHGWDPKGPPTLIDMRGAVDADGKVVGWESTAFIPDRPKTFPVTLVAAELAGLPKDEAFPGNIHQGLAVPYAFANSRATARWLAETPFKPSWIRTPGRMQNSFANESFLDELAATAGVDPLAMRRRHLEDARGLELLDRLARLADWKPRTGPRAERDVARGRGLSYIKYELVRTYVGVVADVVVDRRTGKVRVERVFVAHDCGQIINPDGLRNQIEGNVVQTVSRTLIEELTFDRSTVTSLDWASYPILTFPDVPDVVIDLIDRPAEKPWGAGEPSAAIVPSAIGNAIFDATGIRLRSVPFRPAKVLAALRAA
ncbi:MAG: molybdopterin cofactor-binding domain-containing protein [Alphaproteobacteria bacterium]